MCRVCLTTGSATSTGGLAAIAIKKFGMKKTVDDTPFQPIQKENDIVHQGDKLYSIDDREQRMIVEQASANVSKARASIATAQADILTQQSNLNSAKAAVETAKATYDDADQIAQRNEGLHKVGVISDQANMTSTKTSEANKARWQQAIAWNGRLRRNWAMLRQRSQNSGRICNR